MMTRRALALFLSILALVLPCFAHVGSPDVYFQGEAGPYHLMVVVRTPQMIPGVAEIEIRTDQPGVRQIRIAPLYIVGPGSKYPPPPDVLKPTPGDPQYFTRKLWLMASGSWKVSMEVEGDRGSGTLAVPVPAFARNTLPMQRSLGVLLFALMTLLVAAIVSIVAAARREGGLAAGEMPGERERRGAKIAMGVALAIVLALLFLGGEWWKSAAAENSNNKIYRPPLLTASLDSGSKLVLRMGESRWHARRPETVMTSLIPDHGHLMHLFLLRMPGMDRFYHLHPEETAPDEFAESLPSIAAGHYKIFADIVRASGFPDTMVTEIDLPEVAGGALEGDDSEAFAPAEGEAHDESVSSPLADGGRMIWKREPEALSANRLLWFRFRVEDAQGRAAQDLEPYMGMAGHAEFIRSDFSVFAHVHPGGSASMAAVSLANEGETANRAAGMEQMDMGPVGAEVAFPYGFPRPGVYRIFVQVKRGSKVETGAFDARVN
jgi:hypothetical protein